MIVKTFPSMCLMLFGVLMLARLEFRAADAPQPQSDPTIPWIAPPGGTNDPKSFLFTNAVPRDFNSSRTDLTNSLSVLTNRLMQDKEKMLPAGVYKTEPFSMIVISPGPVPDDRSIRPYGSEGSTMPQHAPELRFKPWPSPKPLSKRP